MPTYEYACGRCGHQFEEFQSITAAPLRKCPKCAQRSLNRLIGTGAGIIFRGSGFYQTDYRSESYKKAAEAEKKAASGGNGDGKAAAKGPESSGSSGSEAAKPAKSGEAAGGTSAGDKSADGKLSGGGSSAGRSGSPKSGGGSKRKPAAG